MSQTSLSDSVSRTLEQVRQGRSFTPDSFETAKETVFFPLWILAWYPLYTLVGGFLAGWIVLRGTGWSLPLWQLALLVVVTWGASVVYVNRTARPIMDAFERDARSNAQEILALGGDVSTYTLRYKNGEVPFVRPPKELAPTSLVLGESSVAIHNDASLDMAWLDPHVGDNTSEMFYDQIASVDYDEPNLKIQLTTGTTKQFPSTRNPDDVLHDLQQRIRQHKR